MVDVSADGQGAPLRRAVRDVFLTLLRPFTLAGLNEGEMEVYAGVARHGSLTEGDLRRHVAGEIGTRCSEGERTLRTAIAEMQGICLYTLEHKGYLRSVPDTHDPSVKRYRCTPGSRFAFFRERIRWFLSLQRAS